MTILCGACSQIVAANAANPENCKGLRAVLGRTLARNASFTQCGTVPVNHVPQVWHL